MCLAESINKWVERMAARGGWRPLSGLICEIVNSVGQGNFTFVREKSGISQGISNSYGCGNHDTTKCNFRQSQVFDLSCKTNRTKNSFINFQCNLINNNKNVY